MRHISSIAASQLRRFCYRTRKTTGVKPRCQFTCRRNYGLVTFACCALIAAFVEQPVAMADTPAVIAATLTPGSIELKGRNFPANGIIRVTSRFGTDESLTFNAETAADSNRSFSMTVPIPAGFSGKVKITAAAKRLLNASTNSCLNSDGTPCPASYLSGPLGKANILPAKQGALLIDQYGGYGTSWAEAQAGIVKREADLGRKFDSIQIQSEKSPDTGENREQWILDTGHSFVTMAWTPSTDIGAINRGEADDSIAAAAQYWKKLAPAKIMIRAFVEFNLRQEIATTACGTPFQQAWQRMVKLFQANGATNVGFWYNPDEGNNRQCIIDSYPGDAYVDWVGSDSYNWCQSGNDSCWSTPLHAGPATFGELFYYPSFSSPSQHDLFGPRKPFVIGETGCAIDPGGTQVKLNYLRSIPQGARSMKYMRGVSFFDQDVTAVEGPRNNFRVDVPTSDPAIFAAFKESANDAWFKAGVM